MISTNQQSSTRQPGAESSAPTRDLLHRVLFTLFFLSGFCGLLYQIVWTRLAFAAFGFTTPVLSVVISTFMLGLALGSWFGGWLIEKWTVRSGRPAMLFYAWAEFGIGLGAFLVPQLFALGDHCLLSAGEKNSLAYLSFSAVIIAFSLLPWCVCMGTTFPFMMAYLRARHPAASASSFSFLYLANVMGALVGTLMTALVLIELLGFRKTLLAGALANFLVAGSAAWLGTRSAVASPGVEGTRPEETPPGSRVTGVWLSVLLFTTGFVSMAMEVVWIRAFTPYLKTEVYSFAMVLFVYLLATGIGSALYRRHLKRSRPWSLGAVAVFLLAAGVLPVVINDPRWLGELPNPFEGRETAAALKILLSLCPFCFLLGYLSPRLIDDFAGGRPRLAGRAYALNVVGCIFGPLFASYVLLPFVGVRLALLLLGVPLLIVFVRSLGSLGLWGRCAATGVTGGLVMFATVFAESFEEHTLRKYSLAQVRHDHVATTISRGLGAERQLLVDGIGIATLTPVTKYMAHLPLAFHKGRPASVLIICFGMGTSYRSALSWNVQTTAIELVPGVKDVFGYYHSDAASLVDHPKGRIVVDDGRRYLKRTAEKFDVISVDTPSSIIQVAGSGLLYSREFCELARQRLRPGGILQVWWPVGGETQSAIARSLCGVFPHVLALPPVAGGGVHFLASTEPFENLQVDELLARIPAQAKGDLLEWNPNEDLRSAIENILARKLSVEEMLSLNPRARITDDRPFNEYYLLRSWGILPSE